jgi:hypothetical protein
MLEHLEKNKEGRMKRKEQQLSKQPPAWQQHRNTVEGYQEYLYGPETTTAWWREEYARREASLAMREARRAQYPFPGEQECSCWLHAGGRDWHWLYWDLEKRGEHLQTFRRMATITEELAVLLQEAVGRFQTTPADTWPLDEAFLRDIDQTRHAHGTASLGYWLKDQVRIDQLNDDLIDARRRWPNLDFSLIVTPRTFDPERIFAILQVDYRPLLEEQEALKQRMEQTMLHLTSLNRQVQALQRERLRAGAYPSQLRLFGDFT